MPYGGAPDFPGDPVHPLAGRRPDPVWDAIRAVWPQGPKTKLERGRWNTAAKELRDGGVTPREIAAAADNWANVMGTATMTPMGLAANLGLLLEGPQARGRSNGLVREQRQRVTQFAAVREERSLTALADEHQAALGEGGG